LTNKRTGFRKNVGKYGELSACYYLENKGFSILERNLVLSEGQKRGEIDILAGKGSCIYIVEVKALRFYRTVGLCPELNLSRAKIRVLHQLRRIFLLKMYETNNSDPFSATRDKVISYLKARKIERFTTKILGIAVDIHMGDESTELEPRISHLKFRVFTDL
jgi:Holliday junction resolvase-like predicted endonuclease